MQNGTGSIAEAAPATSDCTLTVADTDFLAMMTGKEDPQMLYFDNKLQYVPSA
jgi:sterol carrier protein 2